MAGRGRGSSCSKSYMHDVRKPWRGSRLTSLVPLTAGKQAVSSVVDASHAAAHCPVAPVGVTIFSAATPFGGE